MNTSKFIGNVGREPRIFDLPSGEIVAHFNMATNETFVNKDNEVVTKTEWHHIVAWGKTAKIVKKYLRQGSHVVIKAKAVTNKYEKEIDVPVSKTKTIKHKIEVLSTEFQAYDIIVMD